MPMVGAFSPSGHEIGRICPQGSSALTQVANVNPMTENNDPNIDPAGTTQHFRRFVDENPAPEEPARRPILPIVLAAVGAVLIIAVIIALVMAFS